MDNDQFEAAMAAARSETPENAQVKHFELASLGAESLAEALRDAYDEMDEAHEREQTLLALIDELEQNCARLAGERQEMAEALDEMTAAQMRQAPVTAPVQVALPAVIPAAATEEPQQTAPAPSRRPPRVTASSFRRAFGERRLSLLGDDPPDDLDMHVAQTLRSGMPSFTAMAAIALVVFVAGFTIYSGVKQLNSADQISEDWVLSPATYASTEVPGEE